MEELFDCPVCGTSKISLFLRSRDYFLTQEEYTIFACDNCGVKYISPRPDKNEIVRYYASNEYVSHNAGKKNGWNFLYRQVRKYSIKHKYALVNHYAEGKNMLDVGCGTGEFLTYCKMQGFLVTGIEPGEVPRAFAQHHYHLNVYDERFLDNLSLPEFDIITLWHVLEHVHELQDRIKKVVEILKPNGTLIIAVPNSDSWDANFYGNYWAAYDLPRHLYHFSQKSMTLLAEQHKLAVENIVPMKLDAFYISLLSEKYAKGKPRYFHALINGMRSNNFARKHNCNYSSLIFVLKKR